MNSKYRIISKHCTWISLKIQMNIHRRKWSALLNALFPKTLHTDNSNICVLAQNVSPLLHGLRAGCVMFPSYTMPAHVILRQLSLVFGGKIPWRTWEAWKWPWEVHAAVSYRYSGILVCHAKGQWPSSTYIILSSLPRQEQCSVSQHLCRWRRSCPTPYPVSAG